MDKEDAVYIYTMEHYAAIKRNEILPFAMTWMELEGIMLSEISQLERDNYHMTPPDMRNLRDKVGGSGAGKEKKETRWDWEGDKL